MDAGVVSNAGNLRAGHRWRLQTSGFTLLEMLVALVVTGLLVALLSGSLFYALQTREKLTAELARGKDGLALQNWLRVLIGGSVPMSGDGRERFQGRRQELSVLTMGALIPGRLAGPELVTLRLEKSGVDITELIYIERGKKYVLAAWQAAEAEFRYVDEVGKVTSDWSVAPQARIRLLPRLVRLEVRMREVNEIYLAAPIVTDWLEIQPKAPFDIGAAE